jgi:hypothetical protein
MRFSLRTLMIVMLLGGPLLAGAWWWGRELAFPCFMASLVFWFAFSFADALPR